MAQSAEVTGEVQSLLFTDQFGKPAVVQFGPAPQTANAGLLLYGGLNREVKLLEEIAAHLRDWRDPDHITHTLHDLLRQRVYGLLAGYDDGNDAGQLRREPAFRLLLGRALDDPDQDLASQPSLSRFENRLTWPSLMRWAIELLESVLRWQRKRRKYVPRITVDLDPTDDPTHGQQCFSFYHGHYKEHCYLPLLAFATFHDRGNREEPERYLLAALLRPGNAGPTDQAAAVLRRLVARLRNHFPEARIRVRLDGAYAAPAIFRLLEEELKVEYVVNLPKNDALMREAEALLAVARRQVAECGESARVFGECIYRAKTWSGAKRVVIKAEVTVDPAALDKKPRDNPRFVVTNLKSGPEHVYRGVYCLRGAAEKAIGELKNQLALGRTSCTDFRANQVRVLLAATAYVLAQELRTRAAGTEAARWDVASLRARLTKLAGLVYESTRRYVIEIARTSPDVALFFTLARRLGAKPSG